MASKSKELSNLQRDLLQSAMQAQNGKIWLPKGAADSFPTTYSALISLQRRKLIEPDPAKNPEVVSWTITREGKDAVTPPKASPGPHETVAAPLKASGASTGQKPSARSQGSRSGAVASVETSRSRAAKGKDAVPPAKPKASASKKPAATRSGGRGRT